jgi:hypothetical protein
MASKMRHSLDAHPHAQTQHRHTSLHTLIGCCSFSLSKHTHTHTHSHTHTHTRTHACTHTHRHTHTHTHTHTHKRTHAHTTYTLVSIREPGARGSIARFDMECIGKKSAWYTPAWVGRWMVWPPAYGGKCWVAKCNFSFKPTAYGLTS